MQKRSGAIILRYMTKNNHNPNSTGEKGLGFDGLKLLIDSLADLIAQLRVDLLQRGNEIVVKIREVNDSVDIIAREFKRQSDRSQKS
jgi:hypothetical protein